MNFTSSGFGTEKDHNSFHCGSIYFQNLKNEIEDKLLLNPPMKINLPGLRVMRKYKAEISAAIRRLTLGPRGLPSAPSPALTLWRGSPLRCAEPDPRRKVKPHVP